MAVAVRLTRQGRSNRPFFRVIALDERNQREGSVLELLGTYDPLLKEKNLKLDVEKVHAWILKGAKVSEAVNSLMKRAGYQAAPAQIAELAKKHAGVEKKKDKGRKRSDAKTFVPASARAKRQHAAKIKAEAKTKREAALAEHKAKKAAEAPAAAPQA